MKKICLKLIALTLAIVMLIPSLVSCSKPPEMYEIQDRFRQLVEDSYEINKIFFGEGLETYPRVTDPKSSTKVYEITETDAEGNETVRKIWYYYTLDDQHEVIAFRDSYAKPYTYALVSDKALTAEELVTAFPVGEEDSSDDFYKEIYSSAEDNTYCYVIPYTEKKYDLYYTAVDPADYDYVKFDLEYTTIDSIKEAASKVYSAEYLNSIYDSLFLGATTIDGLDSLSPRYIEYTDDYGNTLLMKSNTIKPLVTEQRKYFFDTATIVKKSNKNFVTIRVDSYLASDPSALAPLKLTMVKQNGEWFLDSATY